MRWPLVVRPPGGPSFAPLLACSAATTGLVGPVAKPEASRDHARVTNPPSPDPHGAEQPPRTEPRRASEAQADGRCVAAAGERPVPATPMESGVNTSPAVVASGGTG